LVKGIARTTVKAATEEAGDIRNIKDVMRASLAVTDADGMMTALQQLEDASLESPDVGQIE